MTLDDERDFSAQLVATIAQVWAAIRRRHNDTPRVVITLASGASSSGLKLGHFAAGAWRYRDDVDADPTAELFVGGEGLAQGPAELLVTLLHEAAHGVAYVRGIKDTSRQGRWHNTKFAQIAAELGLATAKDSRIGWSVSSLADGTVSAYADEIEALTTGLVAYRLDSSHRNTTSGNDEDDDAAGDNDDDKPKRRGPYKTACSCPEPRNLTIPRATYDAGPIVCGLCTEPFTADGADGNNETDEGEGSHDRRREPA